ncbi:MAG TPA: exodeoxyribonuclease VII large subunit [Candidatus Saccharimonadia bacterium]|nr:exodeoxyribonuclease VII large subunit [Candidatus Saccharimonadia bacterium]
MTPQTITVSEFLAIINETLNFAYPEVIIEGEVSSFKVNQGKFIFFDLKDDTNTLGCFMMIHQLKLPIEDGMKIRVTGSPKVTKYSKFSLTVREIELAGEGELRRAMQLLKKKLETEGLFDPSRKRPIPKFPVRLGLITSGASAAYADFIKILGSRWGGVEVLLADVSVQGVAAPDQILGALDYFNHLSPPADVLVLIRGGGSLEDLMAFSTEPVARAVAASRTPTVVGVGHEVDFSLADYAADLRAATPTDAARLVVPDRTEITAHITHLAGRQSAAVSALIAGYHRRTDGALGRLEAALRYPREHLAALRQALERGLEHVLTERHTRVTSLTRLLQSLDPKAVLGRGYAIVRSPQRIVRRAADAGPGTPLMIQLAEETIAAEVTQASDNQTI